MIAEWQQTTLGRVCEISSALVDPREPGYRTLPHVGGANIESMTGVLTGVQTAETEGLTSGKFVFGAGTVLYSKIRPYLQKVARPDFQGLCSADIYPLTPDASRISRDYLYYLLLSEDFTEFAEAGSARAGMPKVNRDHLFAYPFALPPLPEQRRIVGILDEAFKGIEIAKANAERNAGSARALFERSADQFFSRRGDGCPLRPLEDCVAAISTGPFGSLLHRSDYEVGGIPLVNPINIVGGKIQPDERKAVSAATAERLGGYRLGAGDVVIGRRGEIGRCAVVEPEQSGWLCGTGSFVIRASSGADPYFLCQLLRSRPYRERLEGASDRATMPSISNKDLAGLVVALPSIEAQRKAAASLARLEAAAESLAFQYHQKIAACEALRRSVLGQAFKGAL